MEEFDIDDKFFHFHLHFIAGWDKSEGEMHHAVYGPGNGLGIDQSVAINGGANYFFGGQSAVSTIFQNIDLADGSSKIDLGIVRADLSGWLGGFGDQEDYATLHVQWLDSSGNLIRSDSAPTVTAAN